MKPTSVPVFAAALLLFITGVKCLKNVKLEILPKDVVDYGSTAVLRCKWEVGSDDSPVYSIKYYRKEFNFFSYSADDEKTHFHNSSEIQINVDQRNSNKSQVVLRNVKFELTGNFSCEVTLDAPSYSTRRSYKMLHVVSVPKDKPVIKSEKTRYRAGDTLRVNCTSPTSTPRGNMTITLNNNEIDEKNIVRSIVDKQDYYARKKKLPMPVSQNQLQFAEVSQELYQFNFGTNGELKVRCRVNIPGIDGWESSSELQLGEYKPWEPKTERVTSKNTSINCNRVPDLVLLGLILLHLHLR